MSQDHPHSEDELLSQVAKGNQDATRILFERYYPRLYYFALKLTQNESEAQDQAQEAFLALWQRKETFRNASIKEAEAFMITVVRNRAYNYNKHQKIKTDKQTEIAEGLEHSDDFLEAQVVQEDIFNRIYQEILALSPNYLELLKLIYVEGLETNEIAERLNTTPNNIRNQKARALEKLKTLLLRKGLFTSLLSFFYLFL